MRYGLGRDCLAGQTVKCERAPSVRWVPLSCANDQFPLEAFNDNAIDGQAFRFPNDLAEWIDAMKIIATCNVDLSLIQVQVVEVSLDRQHEKLLHRYGIIEIEVRFMSNRQNITNPKTFTER